jgi:hypothetical protein
MSPGISNRRLGVDRGSPFQLLSCPPTLSWRNWGDSVFADPKQIDRATSVKEFKQALDWDATNDNKVTSKKAHHKACLNVRADLTDELGMTDVARF